MDRDPKPIHCRYCGSKDRPCLCTDLDDAIQKQNNDPQQAAGQRRAGFQSPRPVSAPLVSVPLPRYAPNPPSQSSSSRHYSTQFLDENSVGQRGSTQFLDENSFGQRGSMLFLDQNSQSHGQTGVLTENRLTNAFDQPSSTLIQVPIPASAVGQRRSTQFLDHSQLQRQTGVLTQNHRLMNALDQHDSTLIQAPNPVVGQRGSMSIFDSPSSSQFRSTQFLDPASLSGQLGSITYAGIIPGHNDPSSAFFDPALISGQPGPTLFGSNSTLPVPSQEVRTLDTLTVLRLSGQLRSTPNNLGVRRAEQRPVLQARGGWRVAQRRTRPESRPADPGSDEEVQSALRDIHDSNE